MSKDDNVFVRLSGDKGDTEFKHAIIVKKEDDGIEFAFPDDDLLGNQLVVWSDDIVVAFELCGTNGTIIRRSNPDLEGLEVGVEIMVRIGNSYERTTVTAIENDHFLKEVDSDDDESGSSSGYNSSQVDSIDDENEDEEGANESDEDASDDEKYYRAGDIVLVPNDLNAEVNRKISFCFVDDDSIGDEEEASRKVLTGIFEDPSQYYIGEIVKIDSKSERLVIKEFNTTTRNVSGSQRKYDSQFVRFVARGKKDIDAYCNELDSDKGELNFFFGVLFMLFVMF